MKDIIKENAKAFVLLFIIIVLAILDKIIGLDINLDVEHYIGLLIADLVVWATPNKTKTD